MKGYINISTTELINVCSICIENIMSYDGSEDQTETVKRFSYRKLRKVEYKLITKPNYMNYTRSVLTHLHDLLEQAYFVDKDKFLDEDKKFMQISLSKHQQLYKLKNKCEDFNPTIFVNY